jgi:hypothetical protein
VFHAAAAGGLKLAKGAVKAAEEAETPPDCCEGRRDGGEAEKA